MDSLGRLVLVIVAVALVAAVVLATGRAAVERSNRTVAIVIDADDARQLAAAAGISVGDLAGMLRDAGASALAVREVTVGELVDSGRVMAMSAPGRTNLAAHEPELAAVLGPAISARLPHAEVEVAAPSAVVGVDLTMSQLADTPVVLRPEDIRAARQGGLDLVARLRNFPAASPQAIEAAAAEAEAAGARLVVFDEEEVLGYDALLTETASALREHDLLYGSVEMAAQMGAGQLAGLLAHRLVRVHSIGENDLPTMVAGVAVPRYARAVRERNIRACYVRLLVRPHPDPLEHNLAYVAELVETLEAQGFSMGVPAPFAGPPGWPARLPRALAGLGVVAALVVLLRRALPVPCPLAWGLLVVGGATGLGLGLSNTRAAVTLAGLGAALAFPTLGVVLALQAVRDIRPRAAMGELVGAALGGLMMASATTLVGALIIVALYSDAAAIAGVWMFSGVKLSLLLPPALVAFIVIADPRRGGEPARHWWGRVRLRFGQFFARHVTVLEILLALAALSALLFIVTRSGNQPLVAPSALELKARGLLESVLVIRPRTKEFLVGHPALMLAVALSLRGRRAWLPLVALAAGLGQASLLNTFCHFHTPLHVSFLRAGNGLWLGAFLGVIAIVAWRGLIGRGGFDSPR